MHLLPAVLVAACALIACAQTADPPEVKRAAEEADRLRTLVEAGALPRNILEQVEHDLADAEDARILERTLYGNLTVEDLTESEAGAMLAAAKRRLDRRKAKLEHAKKLVEEGALPRLSLTPYIEEMDRSRRAVDLADSRARLLRELAEMARAEVAILSQPEAVLPHALPQLAERFLGDGMLRPNQIKEIAAAFEKQFARPLPVSARGGTALHRSLGFDHRGRVDVALDPDKPEGLWLRGLLHSLRIPFFAFRTFVPGKSTGPHIHIGPPSVSIRGGG